MSYCFNPNCQKSENPTGTKYCQSCGQAIALLKNRYQIIRPLGQGGFGKTFLAQDTDRRSASCVVKQFAPAPGMQSNPQVLQKATELFYQESDRLLQLDEHPQIPTLFDYFEDNSCLYLVQQFIKGKTLLHELEEQGTFNEQKIRRLLQDLLPVLQFVHEHKVIHRDLKPENIIRRQVDGKLVLIDFGVAKQGSGTVLTQAGTTVGTPGYAPIEQMRGVTYPASDLYSLGVTCIRLLTGCLPKHDGSDELYDNLEACWLWREKLPSGATISSELELILERMLQDLVKQRYRSASEVLTDLHQPPKPTIQSVQGNITSPDADDDSEKLDELDLALVKSLVSYFEQMHGKILQYYSSHHASREEAEIVANYYLNTASRLKEVNNQQNLKEIIEFIEKLKDKVSRYQHESYKYRWSTGLEKEVLTKLRKIVSTPANPEAASSITTCRKGFLA
jgi:serine/threonine protein kinase